MLRKRMMQLKWWGLVFLPAFSTLVGSIGELYQWQEAPRLVAVLNLGGVFLGRLIYRNWQKG